MVDLPFGQEGGKLLPDGLDEVWWERGHGRTPSSGSLENSPHDRAACARLSSRLIVSLSAQGLSNFSEPGDPPCTASHPLCPGSPLCSSDAYFTCGVAS